jgi:hypothetical protein
LVWKQDVGIVQVFYSQAVLQRTIVYSPAFLESGLAEKIVHTPIEEVGARVLYIFLTSEKTTNSRQSRENSIVAKKPQVV